MADTILKLKVEAGKDFFHVYDKTGKYDKKKNKGGWGSPNYNVSEVTEARVKIFFPDNDIPSEVDVFPNLPNKDCIGFEIIPDDVGLDEFPPGVIRFELHVLLYNGVSLVDDCYIFYYQPLECCISKKAMNTDILDASSPEALKVIELQTLLKDAKRCACGGKMECAQEISEYIWINCNCCC